jgi:phosphoenolpyruvate synthase/pyruvate phosphate dikinase
MKLPKLTNPIDHFNPEELAADISFVQKNPFESAFIRRRIVLFMDGYRYAHAAAQKRWGITFAFYETGHEPVKRIFYSNNTNPDGAAIWLAELKKDPTFGSRMVEELKQVIELEKRLAKEVPTLPLTREGAAEAFRMHLDWWIQFFELAHLWFAVDNIKDETDKEIKTVWESADSVEDFLSRVYRPMRFPMSSIEQRDLLALVPLQGEELQGKLEEHWHKYRHLTLHNIDDEYFDLGYYQGRIDLLKDPKEYQNQLEMLAIADKELEEANQLMARAPISEKLRGQIEFVRWFMYLRTESIDHFMLVASAYKSILEFLSKEFELPQDAVLNMTYKEIFDSLAEGTLAISKEIVMDRTQNGYAYFIGPEHSALVVGEDIERLQTVCLPKKREIETRELKGQIAFKGKVRALARVILDRRNSKELKDGEILVTTMTSPDFVPAMKRSAGIITNEGGVLCHAAIMSRELRKPCVIGTKIATDAIKTGQMVTLDADTGTITLE